MSSKVGFFCQWTVENYSFCVKENLSSPVFTVTMLNDTRWNLWLQVRRDDNKTNIFCTLKRNNDKGPSNIKLFYEISIRGLDHKFVPKYASQVEEDFERKNIGNEIFLMSYNDRDGNFKDLFEKETLIVCCRMWKAGITDTIKYFIRTPIKTHKRYIKWVLKDISSLNKEEYLFQYSEKDLSPYKLKLIFWKHESSPSMHTYIYQMEPSRQQLVKCKISLLDTEEKILVSKQGKYFFTSTEGAWSFPCFIESQWILNYKDSLLPNNTLYLLAEMQMGGAGVDQMERINFGDSFDELLVSLKDSKDLTTQSNTLTANSLMDNLLNFYNGRKLCDVVLKTDSSTFPVHKVILCAQSSVFTTMLETDLMEKQTGTIPLPNMSDDTVKKMIMFMYTDQVEGLEFEGAVNLYLASDQYDIVQLKRLCRDFLKSNLDISNITDALVVADLHQDEELKNASHDFIFEHDSEVIASDKWNQFMQDHLKLAAETLQFMYRRKLEK